MKTPAVGTRHAARAARGRRRGRPGRHLPHLDRRRRLHRRPAHQPAAVRAGARRHRRPAPDRVHQVLRSATSTATCRSTPRCRSATSGGSWSSRRAGSSRASGRCPTTSARCTRRRCARFWPPTRTSRASGPGRRTADRCGPGRARSTCAPASGSCTTSTSTHRARLAADPDADPARLTADWVRQTFTTTRPPSGDRPGAGAVARRRSPRASTSDRTRSARSRRSASNPRR